MRNGYLHVALAICMILMAHTVVQGQDSDTMRGWYLNGLGQVNFSQAAFINWSKGGENNIAVTSLFNINADRYTEGSAWNNQLKLSYGKIKSGEQVRKSEDLMELTSKYSRKITEKINYAALLNFRSQFDKGYNYPDDSTVVSKFLSPAITTISLGIDYKPTPSLSFLVSPLTGKFTYVHDTIRVDQTRYGLDPGEQWREELGALLKMTFQKEVMKNVQVNTSLELFSNYLSSPGNIDVNWETLIGLTVNQYIQASISTQLIYDHDILVPKENDNGEEYLGHGTQFKEIIAVGLQYQF